MKISSIIDYFKNILALMLFVFISIGLLGVFVYLAVCFTTMEIVTIPVDANFGEILRGTFTVLFLSANVIYFDSKY